MAWAKPEHIRKDVNRAGQAIARSESINIEEYVRSLDVINNWRSAHSYPLNSFQINLRARARKVQTAPLISQRLKRLESIISKLIRDQTSTMQLSQMQDIGGCRAVLQSNKEVYEVASSYRSGVTKKFLHELIGEGKDYIQNPKTDGYRSIHLIFRYVGTPENNAWDRLRIEMQLRSFAQHSWATALEAVDIFTRQALKANRGNEDWQRFFALMGSAIARQERCPLVPGTPEDARDLRREIQHYAERLDVLNVLPGFSNAIQIAHGIGQKNASYYLLHLSFNTRKVSWNTFSWNESQRANEIYTRLEQDNSDRAGEYFVLVKADSLSAMKRSYPSFFLDTGVFARMVADAAGLPAPSATRTRES
jgi:hypothetical protein